MCVNGTLSMTGVMTAECYRRDESKVGSLSGEKVRFARISRCHEVGGSWSCRTRVALKPQVPIRHRKESPRPGVTP